MKKVIAWLQGVVDSVIGKSVMNIAENAGKSKLEAILQDLHDSNESAYKAALEGGVAFVNALQPLAAKTETTIDDAILEDIHTVIVESAAKNNFTL